MSKERCVSLDRAMRYQQERRNLPQSGGYMPQRSPHRSPPRTPSTTPYSIRSSPSTPEILRTSFPSRLGEFSLDEFEVCPTPRKLPRSKQLQYEHEYYYDTSLETKERQQQQYMRKVPHVEDLPDDYLEDYVEPSFYEPAAHSSFDEIMCILASPPREQLPQIPTGPELEAKLLIKEDYTASSEKPVTPTRRYKIPPLPDDPYDIPPHPKDPKDVVGLIRRARAIERLKALEAAEAAKTIPKGSVKRGGRATFLAKTTASASRRPGTIQVLPRGVSARPAKPPPIKRMKQMPVGALRGKKEHPPDYIAPEYAAAILQARKLAGLKTTNPKLLPKLLKQAVQPQKEILAPPVLPSTRPPVAATYESVMERAAAIRARAADADGKLFKQMASEVCPITSREAFTSSPPQPTAGSPPFVIPPVIRLHDLKKRQEAMPAVTSAAAPEECRLEEYDSKYLKKLDDVADWTLADISGPQDICITPQVAETIKSSGTTFPATLDNTILEDMEMPDFDNIGDSICARELDTIADSIALEDITMPETEEISLNELVLEDITSPELDDLSISVPKGIEPDYTLELSDEERDDNLQIADEQPKSTGFLTTVVSAVVDKFRNIFGATPKESDEDEDEQDRCIRLDSTLPNLFEATSPPPQRPVKPTEQEEITIIPKYPKEYIAMVKKAQLIHKLKAKEDAEKAAAKGKLKLIPKRTPARLKRGPPGKKPEEPPAKIYPPGEYSPGYAAVVARARTLAGYKNISAILNPERAAKIAALKAAKEAELAAEEALPPVERMRKRMARLPRKRRQVCPSVEILGTLEAIRASLPRQEVPSTPKTKWTPAVRHRVDKRVGREERVFTKTPARVFDEMRPMTPLEEESYTESDLISFSPLRPLEGRLRLQYLQEQAERQAHGVCPRTIQEDYRIVDQPQTPEPTPRYSPIRLRSPGGPKTKEIRKERVTTNVGENGGEESTREEVIETSTIENGEIHTTTRKVTKKTDEFGNVTTHIEEGTGLTAEGDAIADNIDAIEAPDFLDISDISRPQDSSIPTPSQIIDRIRNQVQEKLNLVLPQVSPDVESQTTPTAKLVELPRDLPEEQLYDIDIPEFDITPQHTVLQQREQSPEISLPYYWREEPKSPTSQTVASRAPTPIKVVSPEQAAIQTIPQPKPKSPEGLVVIPPFPKDPKDYAAIVKIAQAIHKRKQQEEAKAAALAPPRSVITTRKPVRVPISRRLVKKVGKQMLPKKKSKKIEPQITQQLKEIGEQECPEEPPPLPPEYRAAVAKARQLAGYKCRTAALNPEVAAKEAAKKAAEEAALAEYEALSEYQKILRRMEKVRQIPHRKLDVHPTIEMIGTLEAIRANLPPTEEVPTGPSTPVIGVDELGLKALEKQAIEKAVEKFEGTAKNLKQQIESSRNVSLDEFEALEREMMAAKQSLHTPLKELEASKSRIMAAEQSRNESLDEFEALEREIMAAVKSRNASLNKLEACKRRMMAAEQSRNASLDEFEALERQMMAAEDPRNASLDNLEACKRRIMAAECSRNESLDEFEALEREIMAAEDHGNASLVDLEACKRRVMAAEYSRNVSLDEFEALEREIMSTERSRSVSLDEFENIEKEMGTAPPSSVECEMLERKIDPKTAMHKRIAELKMQLLGSESPAPTDMKENAIQKRIAELKIQLFGPKSTTSPDKKEDAMQKRIAELQMQLLGSGKKQPSAESTPQIDECALHRRIAELKLRLLGSVETPKKTKTAQTRNIIQETSPAGTSQAVDDLDFYKGLIAEFGMARKRVGIYGPPSTYNLMPLTPEHPVERLRKIKEAQHMPCALEEIYKGDETILLPPSAYSPIPFSSPSEKGRPASSVQAIDDHLLVDLQTPQKIVRPKRFVDLEDMPFDQLEFENAPSLVGTSFEQPMTPPPHPSELISRIRQQVQERIRQDQMATPAILQLPHELPEEVLFEISAPSFAETPGRVYSPHAPEPKTTPSISAPSPEKTSIPSIPYKAEVIACPKVPKSAIEDIYRPKYPKGYVELVKKAQAIHKLRQQQEMEKGATEPPSEPAKKISRIAITKRSGKFPAKKGLVRPPKTIKRKGTLMTVQADDTKQIPSEPPPLPADYVAAVARARQLAGYKNRTAALNPEVAARIAQEKATAEAEAAAYAALPEYEKIKIRMERLRSKRGGRRRRVQPTMEQLAFIEYLKEASAYKIPSESPSVRTDKRIALPSLRVSLTPRANAASPIESPGLAEFEALEKLEAQYDILDEEQPPEFSYDSLIEPVSPDRCKMIANAQWQQLATPPRTDPRERYKRILAQTQLAPTTPPPLTPIQTPDIHFSPVSFPATPTSPGRGRQAEKTTTKVIRSGDSTIKEQVGETRGTSALEEALEDIEEPSYLDITPITPSGAPRPRDIIERIRRDVKIMPRPDVPTGRLIEVRTPPQALPLPQAVLEEQLVDISCPILVETPLRSPKESPSRSPLRSQDVSIPELFAATPPPPTPPLAPVSPLRYRVHSPEGPIIIPPYPKDPTDYAAMVRMSRKIYELKIQQEAEAKAAADAAAIEASKPKEKVRVPISKWTAPPPKKARTRKRLVMKKRAPVAEKLAVEKGVRECPSEPPPLPEDYIKAVARARQLAGLKNTTAALNPEYAAREAARLEKERTRVAALNAPATYDTLMSKYAAIREQGRIPRVQPSLEAAAYLNAVKEAMEARQPPLVCPTGTAIRTPPVKRYEKIKAAAAVPYCPPQKEYSLDTTLPGIDIPYTPIRLDSPRREYPVDIGFDIQGLEDIGDLAEVQEPSFMEIDQTPITSDHYRLPAPRSPQLTPSGIIRRIRKEVQQKLAAERLEYPSMPPATLDLPTDLPEEELLEMSAPSFAKTPQRPVDSPIRSPNLSIPHYFKATPTIKGVTPKPATPMAQSPQRMESIVAASPLIMGIHPGLRVKTPIGHVTLPPHPKGPEDVVAMIRRAQLIHKLKLKEDASRADARLVTRRGVRVPVSQRLGRPAIKVAKKMVKHGKSEARAKKMLEPQRIEECPAEPPELPAEYVAAVARARRLAGLKNTTALLNPPQDFGTIMTRVAALKAARGEIEPSSQELQAAQNLIKRPRKVEKEEFQTPRPALERYRALRSRAAAETPTTSHIPYSPVTMPDTYHVPVYKPVCLRSTPPFYQDINVSNIGDTSMPIGGNDDTDIGDISMPFDIYDYDYDEIEEESITEPVLSESLAEFEAMERLCQVPTTSESLTEFEAMERMCQEPELSESLTEFEAMERMCREAALSESLTEFEAMERMCREASLSESLKEFEAMEKMCQEPPFSATLKGLESAGRSQELRRR